VSEAITVGSSPAAILDRRPIFIQAMWRTGSTYFWKKFRAQPEYRACYEPLHELLIRPREQVLAAGDQRRAASLRHPPIDRSYFTEFPFAGERGVKFFGKPLSYERYCLEETEEDAHLRRYIANLIRHAMRHQQRAVLQFNRGLLRCGWLTRNFSPVNVLVVRRPANVWKSILSFTDRSFIGALCIVLGQNKAKWPLKFLPDWLDLPCRIGPAIEDDYAAYAPIAAELASRMYPAYFDFYLASILHCARYADCILDIDELSENPAARVAAQRSLRKFGIDMDFTDCSVPSYDLTSADEREWIAYEDFAHRFLRATLPADLLLPKKTFAHRPLLSKRFCKLLGEFLSPARSSANSPEKAAAKHVEGLRLFQASRMEESAKAFGEALACQPNCERWNDWATAQAACSRLMLAEMGFRQALKIDRWNNQAAVNLGAVLTVLGRDAEALPLLEQARRGSSGGSSGQISSLLARVRSSIGGAASNRASFPAVQSRKLNQSRHSTRVAPNRGLTVFFTGLSGAGKSSLATELRTTLLAMGTPAVTLLDGDSVRTHLSSELGFSKSHRDLNIRRVGFVAAEVTRHGGIAICAAIAPYDESRKHVRMSVEEFGSLVLVHVATPLVTCEKRDAKGLYAKARAGVIPHFTGVSDPYEDPVDAEIRIDTSLVTVEEGTRTILSYLVDRQLIPAFDSKATLIAASA
jgi:adenylyl-sulfate kinase